jgi:hypothetical protein
MPENTRTADAAADTTTTTTNNNNNNNNFCFFCHDFRLHEY